MIINGSLVCDDCGTCLCKIATKEEIETNPVTTCSICSKIRNNEIPIATSEQERDCEFSGIIDSLAGISYSLDEKEIITSDDIVAISKQLKAWGDKWIK